MKSISKEVSSLVAQRKNELNLRLEDLAKRTGLSVNTISGITSGKAQPTLYSVERLLEAVGYGLRIIPTDELKREREQKILQERFYRQ